MSKLYKYHRNPEDLEEAILRAKAKKLRADGLSDRKIYKNLGITYRKLIKLVGLPPSTYNKKLETILQTKAKKLRSEGIPDSKIQKILGIGNRKLCNLIGAKLRRYSKEEEKKLERQAKKLRTEGVADIKIHKELGISIRKLRKLIGGTGTIKKYSKRYQKKAQNLWKRSTLTSAEIGKIIGASTTTIWEWCQGLKRPEGTRNIHRSVKIKRKAQNLCKHSTLSYEKISEKVKVPSATVFQWCQGLKRPKGIKKRKRYSENTKEKVQNLWKSSPLTSVEISKKVGVSWVTVYEWCKGLKRSKEAPIHSFSEKIKSKVRDLWENSILSSGEIGRKVKVHSASVLNWCKGLKRPKGAPGKNDTSEKIKSKMRDLWENSILSPAEIGKKVGVSTPTVYRWCNGLRRPEGLNVKPNLNLEETILQAKAKKLQSEGMSDKKICEKLRIHSYQLYKLIGSKRDNE